jgi:hypothetical protein
MNNNNPRYNRALSAHAVKAWMPINYHRTSVRKLPLLVIYQTDDIGMSVKFKFVFIAKKLSFIIKLFEVFNVATERYFITDFKCRYKTSANSI